MNSSLAKVILITGASSGFGKITAEFLVSQGYKVYAGLRYEKEFKSLDQHPNLIPIHLDVTWPQEKIDQVIQKIIASGDRIDVLINNAGFGLLGLMADATETEIKDQFETNFFGQFKVTKSVIPFMRKQKSGLIIMVSSISGLATTAFYGAYSASKASLEALTTSLRFEESVYGINIVAINPGSHKTDFWKNIKWIKASPLVNQKIASIVEKSKWHRHNALNVAKKIAYIIKILHPKKNYLIGLNAHFIYLLFKLIPYALIDWLGKKVVKKIISPV